MSPVNRSRLRFAGFVGAAFVVGLMLSGLLDLPLRGAAQQVARRIQPASVTAPAPGDVGASARQLNDLSEAFASRCDG